MRPDRRRRVCRRADGCSRGRPTRLSNATQMRPPMSMQPPMSPPGFGPPAYGPPGMSPPMAGPPPAKPQTVIPMVAAILMIVAAIDGMTFWAVIAFSSAAILGLFGPFAAGFQTLFYICGAIAIIFGIIEILGGVMALRRRMWSLALVGSILGLFFFGWLGFEASLLSLVALILLVISRKEF